MEPGKGHKLDGFQKQIDEHDEAQKGVAEGAMDLHFGSILLI
jgi:hypothetical protein